MQRAPGENNSIIDKYKLNSIKINMTVKKISSITELFTKFSQNVRCPLPIAILE